MADHRVLLGRSVAIEADGDSYKGFRHHRRDLSLQYESYNRAATIAIGAILHKQLKLAKRFSALYGDRLEATETNEMLRKLDMIDSDLKTKNSKQSAVPQNGRRKQLPPTDSAHGGDSDSDTGDSGSDDDDVFAKPPPVITHFEKDIIMKNKIGNSALIVTGATKQPKVPSFHDMINMKRIDEQLYSDKLKQEELYLKNRVKRWKANMALERAVLTDKFRSVSIGDGKHSRPKSCSASIGRSRGNTQVSTGDERGKRSATPRLMETCDINDVMAVLRPKTGGRDRFPPVKSPTLMKPRSAVRWRDEAGEKLTERLKSPRRVSSAISYRLKNNVW